ncbi:MAG TPA: Stk1 family PASTA domain-containing Ser/Thr kinase [Ornithinibacter sp.]|nr:Stk1 family PASTA domain-containing Ser/Thr kinase [Ornithinibacter sp.]
MPEVPKLLGGRYEVGELLGRGGMAEVHRGHDSRLGRQVAIKMLRSELARDNTFLARFRREAQSAAGLNHASIVAVYDHGEDLLTETGGAHVKVPYIVMEFVDGKTLRQVLTERGNLPPTEALRITEGVLDALAYSHRNGIVHRDIKPANVMIAADGSIKVMDFGIARAMADANATMTQTSAVIGTAQYLSPEQAQGQSVDERSDLYSTGCLLFELLTGRPPFLGESPVSVAYQHVGEPPMPPSRLVEGISEDLDAVVLHSLAKPRDARYQTAGDFRFDLQAVRLGRPISDAAHGSAAALAGAAAAGAVVGATQVVPTVRADETQAYAGGPPLTDGPGTQTFPGLEEEPPSKRGPGAWIVLALVAIAALGALAWGLSTYFGAEEVPKVAVPSVVGDPYQTATAKLVQVKLVAEVVRQPSDTVPEDEVISQNPTAGTEVSENSTVRLFVSAGPTAVTVPDLKGLTVQEAQSQLSDQGLEVGTVEEVDDPDTEQGKIIDSNPGAGTSVAPQTKINVRVGTGKVAVPNVVGKSQSEAQSLIAAANLQVETKFRQTNEVPEGQVTAQSPRDGTIEIGGTINITVAQKAAPTVTPTTVTPTPTPTDSASPTAPPSP